MQTNPFAELEYYIDDTIRSLQLKVEDQDNWILGGRRIVLVKKAQKTKIDISFRLYTTFGSVLSTVKSAISNNLLYFFIGGTTGYDTNPITAGKNSMEVYLKADFIGTFNNIDNAQFWRSTDFSPNTGLTLKWKLYGTAAYVTPVTATSTVADDAIPTADPGS